ncbi:tyrosine-type recombinase/integrase [Aeromonas enteropelogenes]|uniref:tyrosine-type recombinase/integrase n=3 Tax=Aeromonas TaxID=642 RepID=UPI003BA0D24D
MQTKFRFTNAAIKALPAQQREAGATELEFSDTEVIGLKLLSGKSQGSKRFLLRYTLQGKKRSIALGRFGDIDVSQARTIARKYKAMLAEGIDPVAERDSYKTEPTLSEFFWQTFLPHLKTIGKRSISSDIQRFKHNIEPRFGAMRYRQLKAMDVLQLQSEMVHPNNPQQTAYAPSTANRVLAQLKTMGSYAVRWGILDTNEAAKIKLLKEDNARTRFLSIEEMKRVIEVALQDRNQAAGSFIAMLYLTGARKSEVLLAKWEHVNWEDKTLFVPLTKNGKSRIIYLSTLAIDILEKLPRIAGNPYVFASQHIRCQGKPIGEPRCAYERVLQKAGIEDRDEVCFHTARHSVASALVSSGQYSLYDVKAQLAHASIQSSQRYAKLTSERSRNISEGLSSLIQAE